MSDTTKPAWIDRIETLHRFALAVAAGAATFVAQPASIPWSLRFVASWDLGTLLYLALAFAFIARSTEQSTRDHASAQDASRTVIFLVVVGASCAGILAIGYVASDSEALAFWPKAWHLALSIVALISSWLAIHTVFAFHYARRYYDAERLAPGAPSALAFPGKKTPDYLDFAYYAFVVGMTSQVSDVAVRGRSLRRLTLIHGVLSFIFNMAVLALAINIIASVF